MKKTGTLFCSLCILFLWYGAALSFSQKSLSISGTVKQPLNLTMDDLRRFESVSVRLNEVTTDRNFHGAFSYHGVPLRTLLELAAVQKKESDFLKPVDLAVIVKNQEGKQTVLSWGEIYYRNPAEIIIAVNAVPIMPHHECSGCHTPEVFKKWFDPLKRTVGLPKLVVANDFYTDRSLEDINAIEVIDLHPKLSAQKMQNLYSPGFSVTGAVKETLNITDIASYPQLNILTKQIGDGKGYHGMIHFGGAPLIEIMQKAGIAPDLNTVFLISAPDGYRSLITYGELLLAPYGRNIIISDRADDQPLKKNGKFIAILPDDLAADRWIKAVEKIEVILLMHNRGQL
ncbi:MAG: molybdopterin-dependent oxidoreductase [Nitrospirota bacterium]